MVYLNKLFLIFATLLFSSCANDIKLNEYTSLKKDKITILESCKVYYENKKAKVAVVNFTNNSNFQSAKISSNISNSIIGIDILDITAGSKKNRLKTTRVANSNLSKSFIPQIENLILNTSGVELYTREDFNKINKELKLQDSGLIDASSIVEFGKLSGVRYLITGSIDYIDHNFKNYSQYSKPILMTSLHTRNKDLQLASLALSLGSTFLDGTKIKTAVTIKVLDVQSSKIVFSKQIKRKISIKSSSKSSYDEIIGAVKSTINDALPQLQKHLNETFPSYSYISKIKSKDDSLLIQLSIGKDAYIKQGDTFNVLNTEETLNPITGKKSCEIYKSNNKLQASQHISKNNTYTTLISGENINIKLFKLVQKIQE